MKNLYFKLFSILLVMSFPLASWQNRLAAQENLAPTVTFAVIGKMPASQPLRYLGRVEAINSVSVFTRTEGFIQKIHFKEGQMVKAGDLLFEINPDVHISEVDQANAVVSGSEAALELAEIMFKRLQNLADSNAVSRADADKARADRDIARASLLQAEATLRARELNLGFTKITAPISGRIGHTRFTTGSFINTGSGSLVDIVQLDPIRVVIPIIERDFISASSNDQRLSFDLLGKDFKPQIRLANGAIYPKLGVMDFIDNTISVQTGSVNVRARFDNPDLLLLPGGAVDVTLDSVQPPFTEVVPIAALQQDQEGHFVLLVNENNQVEVRRVTVGQQLNQYFIVDSGLKEGERVIVLGLQRVRAGMTVNPIPYRPLGE